MNPNQPEPQIEQPTQNSQPAPVANYPQQQAPPQLEPQQPVAYPEHNVEDPTVARKSRRKLVWGLVCLIAPTALLILTIFGSAIANFVISSQWTSAPENTPPIQTIVNVTVFLLGALAVASWLPGLIVGIILLSTRNKT